MKYIKLEAESPFDNQKIIKIFNKYKVKLINGFYQVDDKEFNKIKQEIRESYPNLSIRANPEYVIIKRKGIRIVSTKYVTHKEFDDFKKEVYVLKDELHALKKEIVLKKEFDEFKETTNNNFRILFKHLGIKQSKPKKK